MENYKIIHFESVPHRIKKINDTLFHPNAKYWNKLFSICDTYVKSNFYFKDDNLDTEVYKSEMNKPIILRNCGLNYMKGLRLEKLEFVETDFIFPYGLRLRWFESTSLHHAGHAVPHEAGVVQW